MARIVANGGHMRFVSSTRAHTACLIHCPGQARPGQTESRSRSRSRSRASGNEFNGRCRILVVLKPQQVIRQIQFQRMSAMPRLPQLQWACSSGGGPEMPTRDPDLKLNLFYVHRNAICVGTERKVSE